jgi:hypothetical protein
MKFKKSLTNLLFDGYTSKAKYKNIDKKIFAFGN